MAGNDCGEGRLEATTTSDVLYIFLFTKRNLFIPGESVGILKSQMSAHVFVRSGLFDGSITRFKI